MRSGADTWTESSASASGGSLRSAKTTTLEDCCDSLFGFSSTELSEVPSCGFICIGCGSDILCIHGSSDRVEGR